MTQSQQLHDYLTTWRKAEEKYYGAVLSDPELYMAGIELVRAIASSLKDIPDVEALVETYPRTSISQIAGVAEAAQIRLRDFLDYHLARDAAFYLCYQEILEARAKSRAQAKITEARILGDEWVTIYSAEQTGYSPPLFQQLEMHLTDGLGIYSAIELDWEKGRVYVVEPVMLDPETGEPQREVRAPDPRQEFTTREEMAAAVAALREKYTNHSEGSL